MVALRSSSRVLQVWRLRTLFWSTAKKLSIAASSASPAGDAGTTSWRRHVDGE
jgi:hypothetical protein